MSQSREVTDAGWRGFTSRVSKSGVSTGGGTLRSAARFSLAGVSCLGESPRPFRRLCWRVKHYRTRGAAAFRR